MHACPLRSLELQNFKSIAGSTVEFNPLTVLVGKNSSGKSSLLQAIRFLSQTVTADKPGIEVPLNGTKVRLGTFDDVRTVGCDGPILFRATLAIGLPSVGDDFEPDAVLGLQVEEPYTGRERGQARIGMNQVEVRDAAVLYCAEHWLRAVWDEHIGGYVRHRWESEEVMLGYPEVLYMADFNEADLLTEIRDLSGPQRVHELHDRYCVKRGTEDLRNAFANLHMPTFEEAMERTLATIEMLNQADPRRVELLMELVGIESQGFDQSGEAPDLARWVEEAARHTGHAFADAGLTVFESAAGENQVLLSANRRFVGRMFYKQQGTEPASGIHTNDTATMLDEDDITRLVSHIQGRARYGHEDGEQYALVLSIAEAGGFELQETSRGPEPTTNFPKVAQLFLSEFKDDPWARDSVLNELASGAMEGKRRPAVTILLQDRVRYLGPLRQGPRPFIDFADAGRPDVGAAGEHLAQVLQWHGTKSVDVPGLGQADLVDGLQHWLRELGIAEDVAVEARGRAGVSIEVRPPDLDQLVDLTSVGVGVSQVLPVLAVCLLAEPGDIVLLEQPELHLHPALQMKLADFFLACVDSGRQIIVETHSEHLVNRLRRRAAEDDSNGVGELVRIVFAERDAEGHTVFRPSDINPLGGLSEDWPNGFLDLGARDAQKLLQAGLAKHRRLSED